MICYRCENDEFDYINGLYYCNACQTQTQHGWVGQSNDDEVYANYMHSNKIRIQEATNQGVKKEKKKKYFGRPWTTTEAFQWILKSQVETLIKLDADPALDDIVFRLWIMFLQKSEIAFFKNKASDPEEDRHRRMFQRTRDKYLGSLDDPRAKPVRRTLTYSHAEHKKKLLDGSYTDYDNNADEVDDGLEFYHGDNPSEKPEKEVDPILKMEEEDLSTIKKLKKDEIIYDDEGNPVIKKADRRNVPNLNKITLVKLISLIYVGLQFTDSIILPHDLVRLIREGTLPYNRTELPNDMVTCANDYQMLYAVGIPTPQRIVHESSRMVSFLGLKDLPMVNITQIALRYMIELGLPGEMNAWVTSLIRRRPPNVRLLQPLNSHHARNGDFACLAMAYIVIAIKRLFGLDDKTELMLSKYGQILSSYFEFDPPLFIWRDWVAFATQQMAVDKGRWFPDNVQNLGDIQNVHSAMDHFDAQKGKHVRYSQNSLEYSECRQKIRKDLSGILHSLSSASHRRSRQANDVESGDSDVEAEEDGSDKDQYEERVDLNDPLNDPVETKTDPLMEKAYLFHSSTLKYIIVSPKEFLESLDCQDSQPSSYSQSVDDDLDEEESHDNIDSSVDMFVSHQSRKRKHSGERENPPNKRCRLKNMETTFEEIFRNIPFAPTEDFPVASKSYKLYEIPDWRDSHFMRTEACLDTYETKKARYHYSYEIVLEILSHHIASDPITLQDCVERLELVLFEGAVESSARLDAIRGAFLSKYFKTEKLVKTKC